MTLFLKSLDWVNKDWGMVDLKKNKFWGVQSAIAFSTKKMLEIVI
jgi:hypothetical protein